MKRTVRVCASALAVFVLANPASGQQRPTTAPAASSSGRTFASVCARNREKIQNTLQARGIQAYAATYDLFNIDMNDKWVQLYTPCVAYDSMMKDYAEFTQRTVTQARQYCARPHGPTECLQWGSPQTAGANQRAYQAFVAEFNRAMADPNYSADLGSVRARPGVAASAGSTKSAAAAPPRPPVAATPPPQPPRVLTAAEQNNLRSSQASLSYSQHLLDFCRQDAARYPTAQLAPLCREFEIRLQDSQQLHRQVVANPSAPLPYPPFPPRNQARHDRMERALQEYTSCTMRNLTVSGPQDYSVCKPDMNAINAELNAAPATPAARPGRRAEKPRQVGVSTVSRHGETRCLEARNDGTAWFSTNESDTRTVTTITFTNTCARAQIVEILTSPAPTTSGYGAPLRIGFQGMGVHNWPITEMPYPVSWAPHRNFQGSPAGANATATATIDGDTASPDFATFEIRVQLASCDLEVALPGGPLKKAMLVDFDSAIGFRNVACPAIPSRRLTQQEKDLLARMFNVTPPATPPR